MAAVVVGVCFSCRGYQLPSWEVAGTIHNPLLEKVSTILITCYQHPLSPKDLLILTCVDLLFTSVVVVVGK